MQPSSLRCPSSSHPKACHALSSSSKESLSTLSTSIGTPERNYPISLKQWAKLETRARLGRRLALLLNSMTCLTTGRDIMTSSPHLNRRRRKTLPRRLCQRNSEHESLRFGLHLHFPTLISPFTT